jgi:hypothetical protein
MDEQSPHLMGFRYSFARRGSGATGPNRLVSPLSFGECRLGLAAHLVVQNVVDGGDDHVG